MQNLQMGMGRLTVGDWCICGFVVSTGGPGTDPSQILRDCISYKTDRKDLFSGSKGAKKRKVDS